MIVARRFDGGAWLLHDGSDSRLRASRFRKSGWLNRPWTEIHRVLDRLDIRFDGVLRPCCVSTQHRGDAVSVLLGNPERVATDHQVPTDGGVTGAIGLSITNP
jgi:hypothetical protein